MKLFGLVLVASACAHWRPRPHWNQSPTSTLPKSSSTSPLSSSFTTTSTSSSTPSGSTTASKNLPPDFLRGVNIGGWLVLDHDLNANLLRAANAVNQWTYDSSAQSALPAHWRSYFNESSVQLLKSYGVNALKIPIGYWAYNNAGTPYTTGADAYLEQAIHWAAAAGMKVWIDLSLTDVTGSTVAEVSTDTAANHTLSILQTVAKKYGAPAYANTVTAIQIPSQPVVLPPTSDCAQRQVFAQQALTAIRRVAANLQVVVPDDGLCASHYDSQVSVARSHFQTSLPSAAQLTQTQNIAAVCKPDASSYIGAFSANTVATMHVEGWTADVVAQVRQYVEAQLEAYEAHTQGYFFWSWTNDDEESSMKYWGIKDGVDLGYIPTPLGDKSKRKFASQCN